MSAHEHREAPTASERVGADRAQVPAQLDEARAGFAERRGDGVHARVRDVERCREAGEELCARPSPIDGPLELTVELLARGGERA